MEYSNSPCWVLGFLDANFGHPRLLWDLGTNVFTASRLAETKNRRYIKSSNISKSCSGQGFVM